jgi:hypothetical protein
MITLEEKYIQPTARYLCKIAEYFFARNLHVLRSLEGVRSKVLAIGRSAVPVKEI